MLAFLTEWARILIVTAVAGGIAVLILPEENDKMGKYVKFACCVTSAVIMLMPIRGLFAYLPEVISFDSREVIAQHTVLDSQTSQWIIAMTAEQLEQGIFSTVYQKNGIKPADINIYIKQDTQNPNHIIIEQIIIYIYEGEIYDNITISPDEYRRYLENYLQQLLRCPVEIIVLPLS